ncbi:hypothetical protein LY28_02782 [Ruminiclostridium sufflavum DSM 19573]|uniref:Uncharacterized protein n=1 Tax=Ruminiclostridium sufflavum DSM 19573 TaxID=1121337 RepID=A0A318XJP5_9FIRM|nr:Wadjet anti-phage system protein JetA family protein [Ruminiclostridium sufflavum]PYG86756.1 hypothetical protein LY28_02782 [Ruminiclostridium sufflavum DSM 19573]
MSIFENINNNKFFNPFCCRNKEIYFECINQLIEKSKEIPILYEIDARNCLTIYLQNCLYSIETEDIGEEINSTKTASENASAILRYFRECGWITQKEIGRNGDNIASIVPYCRKVIEALRRIFDNDINGSITNHIFSIYEILKSSLEEDNARAIRPYSNILVPLIENECDLKNELLILKDSIREIMQAVIKMMDANSFGQFLIKDEMLKKFFNDYFFIKRSGLIPGYISRIDTMLSKIRRTEMYDRMVEEYKEIKNISYFVSKDIVDRQFSELDYFINIEYDKEMNYIDKKINTYYNLYSTRMLMILSNNTNLQHYLNNMLMQMKEMPAGERESFLQKISDNFQVQSIGYIGKKSFERRRKMKTDTSSIGIEDSELSDQEKERMTNEVLKEIPDRFNLESVKKYFDNLNFTNGTLSVGEYSIDTKDDAMMVAASIIYSGTAGFPYEVEFMEGFVETEVATISNIRMRRRMGDE